MPGDIPALSHSPLESSKPVFVCWFVCLSEKLPVGFSDDLVSEMPPFRLNPVDD